MRFHDFTEEAYLFTGLGEGPMTVAWTSELELTVERSSKSLMESAVSGEGLVNVYRGTGKILMAPLAGAIKFRDLPKSGKFSQKTMKMYAEFGIEARAKSDFI